MKKLIALLLAAVMLFALVACGNADNGKTYAVEAGSAGEVAAQERGWKVNSVDTQTKALMEVEAGTSDAAIIDLLQAAAMIGEGTSYPNLKAGEQLTEEKYGAGCRKGSDLARLINFVLAESYADGSLLATAKTYKVQASVLEQAPINEFSADENGDVAYIKGKGKLIVGITDFAPMDYKDEQGVWIGFDADMARKVAEKLGVEIEFVEIDWNNKIFELDGKTIDVVWNGMTLTEEVMSAMECTNAYCNNAQVVVTK